MIIALRTKASRNFFFDLMLRSKLALSGDAVHQSVCSAEGKSPWIDILSMDLGMIGREEYLLQDGSGYWCDLCINVRVKSVIMSRWFCCYNALFLTFVWGCQACVVCVCIWCFLCFCLLWLQRSNTRKFYVLPRLWAGNIKPGDVMVIFC